MTRTEHRPLVLLLAFASLLASSQCSSSPEGGHDAAGTDAAASPDSGVSAEIPAEDAGPAVPDTAVGRELRWLLDLLNGPPAAITEAAVAPHFSAAFLQQVPAGTLAAILGGLASSDAPFALRQIEPVAGAADRSLAAITESKRQLFLRFNLALGAGASARLEGLLFQGAPEHDPALRDPATLLERFSRTAPQARLLIARLDDQGGCAPLHQLKADEPMPLGSLFKIYVLGALAARIQAGAGSWQDLITVEENLKSLPSGDLQEEPAGSQFASSELAAKMISISDNTATDHLLRFLGRDKVEAAQTDLGHSRPALNVPFLTTRELFQLKLGATAAERAAYLAADAAGRRRLLDETYRARPLPDLSAALSWERPIEIDRLEWFASPADVCRALAGLRRMGQAPATAPVLNILSANPGLAIDRRVFSYAGFKGGSEPGVVTAGWLLRRAADDGWVVVALGLADPDRAIDDTVALYHALAAVQLAGR